MNQLLQSDTSAKGTNGKGSERLRQKPAAKKSPWPRCSPELVEILVMLSHPAWVESAEGEILFFNKGRLGGAVLSEETLPGISGQTPSGLAVRSKASAAAGAALIAAVAFPVICAMAGHLRIVVVCDPGQESARDQELALALWGKVLKAEADGLLDLRLSPQQLLVYRLLRRGLSYKEMAGALSVAHSTIRVHVSSIRKILGDGQVPVLRRGRGRAATSRQRPRPA